MKKYDEPTGQPFFVSAATIAGNLVSVMQIAREISLAAKNAKAIAERAGEKANGFRPITDYIDGMGHETASLVSAINGEALEVSRIAVEELRASEVYQRLLETEKYSGDNPAPALQTLVQTSFQELTARRAILADAKSKLAALLTEIRSLMRASAVISTCSKVEATQAEEYASSLEVVAENVDAASEKISIIVKDCESLLSTAMVTG